jgi:hypothetical protein
VEVKGGARCSLRVVNGLLWQSLLLFHIFGTNQGKVASTTWLM